MYFETYQIQNSDRKGRLSNGLFLFLLAAFLCNYSTYSLKASEYYFTSGARSAGFSNASVALFDPWAGFQNQALLGFSENSCAGVYHETRFQHQDFSLKSGFGLLHTSLANFALHYNHFGFQHYHEQKLGFTLARMITPKLSAGLQFNFHHTFISEHYSPKANSSFEVGLAYKISPEITAGFHSFNPNQQKIEELKQELPSIQELGFSVQLGNSFILSTDLEYYNFDQLSFASGFEYTIFKQVFLRAGYTNYDQSYSLGIGYTFRNIQADVAFRMHPVLGTSSQFSLTYTFKKRR